MRSALLTLIFLSTVGFTDAQGTSSAGVSNFSNAQQFMTDALGRPLYLHNDYAVEGSPFFSDEYCTANLKTSNGKWYNNIKVKLNLQTNRVIYTDADGKEMEASSAIEKIVFFNCSATDKNRTLVCGFPGIDHQDAGSFYVLLDSGAVQLLKHISINYHDTKGYGSANIIRVFDQKESFYAFLPGKGMTRFSKDNASVIELLADKKSDIQRFIEKYNIRVRKEEDLVKLIWYYNSLH